MRLATLLFQAVEAATNSLPTLIIRLLPPNSSVGNALTVTKVSTPNPTPVSCALSERTVKNVHSMRLVASSAKNVSGAITSTSTRESVRNALPKFLDANIALTIQKVKLVLTATAASTDCT